MDTKERNRSSAIARRIEGRAPAKRSAVPQTKRAETATKSRPRQQQKPAAEKTRKQPSADVVYTQPGPFNRNRFILRLVTVVAVVLALVFGMSIFFKVDADKIMVSGANKYTAWQIREASGIRDGENLLGLSDARISSKIQDALPYVKDVRVGIKLPDTVHIEIVEMEVVYGAGDTSGNWWLISSDGIIVERTGSGATGEHTNIIGVKLESPVVGEKAVAAEEIGSETTADGTIVETHTHNKERLDAAITIMQYMEASGIIGQAASVDVTNVFELEFWYADRFQVKLGDTTQLSYKIRSAKSAIDQMGAYQTGILDASFVLRPDEVIHTSFEQ